MASVMYSPSGPKADACVSLVLAIRIFSITAMKGGYGRTHRGFGQRQTATGQFQTVADNALDEDQSG